MVALLGLLDLLQVGVELVLLGEGGAVDAGEHRVVRIAAPIGARHLHQLEGVADLARRGHMRAAAEIEPVALFVDLDLLVGRNGVDQLDLEILAHVAEGFLGLLARPHFLGERLIARDDLLHLLLDDRQIFQRERLVAEEVVIKTVLDHRADGHLRARPQRLHGFRHDMRGVVADQFERARVLAARRIRSWRRARSGRRDRPVGRRAPWRRCAWPAKAKCPWRCPSLLCLGGSPDVRRRERSMRPCLVSYGSLLRTSAGKRDRTGI